MMESGKDVATRLAWELDSRTSLELRVRSEIQRHGPEVLGTADFDSWEDHYIEMAGRKYCDVVYYLSGKPTKRQSYYGDGLKGADLTFAKGEKGEFDRPQSMVINKYFYRESKGDRWECPQPLQVLYVGREPLSKALARATSLGSGKALDRDCELFLFEKVPGPMAQDHVYYLDKESGIPLQVDAFRDLAAREKKEPLWVWKAETLDKVQGHVIPLKSATMSYKDSQPRTTWTFTVQSVEFNKDFPASTFWPKPDPAVSVLNTITNQQVPAKQTPAKQGSSPATTSTSATTAVDASTPPADWTQAVPGVVLGLGLAVIAASGVLWWRRR